MGPGLGDPSGATIHGTDLITRTEEVPGFELADPSLHPFRGHGFRQNPCNFSFRKPIGKGSGIQHRSYGGTMTAPAEGVQPGGFRRLHRWRTGRMQDKVLNVVIHRIRGFR